MDGRILGLKNMPRILNLFFGDSRFGNGFCRGRFTAATDPIMEPRSLTHRQCLTGQQHRLRHVFMTWELLMERFMYFAILESAAFCFGQTVHVSQDEETVRRFADDFSAAFSQNDAAALDRMTAPDYTFVTPTGTIQNKEQRVEPIRSGDLKYDYAK